MSWLVAAFVACILTAFVMTAVEAALARISHVSADEWSSDGRRGAAALAKILGDSAPHLSVVEFVRVVAEAGAAVSATVAVMGWTQRQWTAVAVAIGVMVMMSFVFVGVTPRTLGRRHAQPIALLAAPMVVRLRWVLGPIAHLLVAVGNLLTPGEGYRDGPFDSEAELRGLVDLAGEARVIEAGERRMIHSVFELGDTVVREVMVPRTDMITVERDKTLRNAMSLFLRSGFSRIPVIGEDSDDILGLLYLKDVARRGHTDETAQSLPVHTLMRPVPFVPDSKPIDDLLREMQRDQTHMAVVIDEYGGTAGLVTIEDVVEEIVGEITDEYDREGPGVEDLGDGGFRVPASLHVDDLAELFDVDLADPDVDTVGGLLAKAIGRVPIVGSVGEIGGLVLTAERMAGRRHRIASVIVRPVEVGVEGSRLEAGAAVGEES